MNKELIGNKLKNLLLNFIGSTLLAFGVCAFIEPFHIIVGGSTGIALVLHRITGINTSVYVFAIGILVLPLGYFFGGKELVVGSVLSSLFFPFSLAIFECFPSLTTLADNVILATVCGGICCGSGIALVLRSGASTGGMDIPALIIAKLFHIPVNKVFNGLDTCIMAVQIPISNVTFVIYGIMYTYIMTTTMEKVLSFGEERLKFSIVSEQYEEIAQHLIENDFGVTMLYAESGYTKTPIKKVESVMRSYQNRRAIHLIEEIDPEAFITIEKVQDVKGRGFTLERNYIDKSW